MIATNERTITTARRTLALRFERERILPHLGLGFALALAVGLNLWNLSQNGYGNSYYAVAVQSMLKSWHNFFFASYDGGGFITVDKPPVGLWIQALSTKLFGFSGLSLLLPEALAGLASVALVFYLVRRVFGSLAGVIAAFAVALTPIAVAIDRTNNMDSLLVLTLVLAAWAISLAAERGRLGLLLLGVTLVGIGFNIKMLEAWIVLP